MESDETGQTLERLRKEAEAKERQARAAGGHQPAATPREGSLPGMGTDETRRTLDRRIKEADEKQAQGGVKDLNKLLTRRPESPLLSELPAAKAEMRQSIVEAIERLPQAKRDLLKDASAVVGIRVPPGWPPRTVQGVLMSIPEIKTRNMGIYEMSEKASAGRPNAVEGLDVHPKEQFSRPELGSRYRGIFVEFARVLPASKEAESSKQQERVADQLNKAATKLTDSSGTVTGSDQAGREMRDKPREGAPDVSSVRDRERREADLTPKQRAESAELTKAIQNKIEGLDSRKRELLRTQDATLDIHIPRGLMGSLPPHWVKDIVQSIPEIGASSMGISIDSKEKPGAKLTLDVTRKEYVEPAPVRSASSNAIDNAGPAHGADERLPADETMRTLDRLIRGAEQREQQPKVSETPSKRGAASEAEPQREHRETALTPEQRAERAEMRASILEAILGLPEDKRALLKNPDAGFRMTLPVRWGLRLQTFLDILDSIPEIKATHRAFEYEKDIGQKSNRIMAFDVFQPRESHGQEIEGRKPPPETAESKLGPDRAEPLAAEERAERRRIANPPDGVGCPYGGLPDRQSVRDWALNRMPGDLVDQLKDPTMKVFVDAYASAPGDKDENYELSYRRGEAVAQVLRSLPGVKAEIVVRSFGSEEATGDSDKDDATQRVVLIRPYESVSRDGRADLPGVYQLP